MYRLTSRLVLYSDLPADSVLMRLSAICRDLPGGDRDTLVHRVLAEVKHLLDIATTYGFDENLWQNYLTFVMIDHLNSFSLTCEQNGLGDGSINAIATADFEIFRQLFTFDFGPLEAALGVDCFTRLTHYRAIRKQAGSYNREVSEKVRALSRAIAAAPDAETVLHLVSGHLAKCGAGLFGMNRAFRVRMADGEPEFIAINNLDDVTLRDLIGYELQKAQLRANVEAFLHGRPFNNMLLYGDAGTGKSTSVKALLNEYWTQGLRVIEIYKHQFPYLADVISRVKQRHYRFVIFIDDLSFEEHEVEYKHLKAVIEGGLETRPTNVMLCATSNRRHLIRETWRDRDDMEHDGDIHRSDTMEEKLSLAARFGCTVRYSAPDRRLFEEIVKGIAARYPQIHLTEEELLAAANRFEIRHGGISGRCAQQFINSIAGGEA